jgi:GNAT superfamily N-acetyltransferase
MGLKLSDLTQTVPAMIAKGGVKALLEVAKSRIYSNRTDMLLRRDLTILFKAPAAKIPIHLRELQTTDIPAITAEVVDRLPAINAGLKTCYLAVSENEEICYMQWLIDSSQNHLRPRNVGLILQPDEMMLEWAYTFEKYRGLGIMASAMAQISERAAQAGARWALTLVEEDNIASLKGCKNAGFRPYQLREEQWRALHLSQGYKPLPQNSLYSFEVPQTG